MPGTHRLTALRLTRGEHQRQPVIDLDGRRVWDSTAIIAALEDYRPEPPLYPADPDERERALALEDYFDEELAPRIRRLIWHHMLPDIDAATDAALPDEGAFKRGLLRATSPVGGRLVRQDYSADEAGAREAEIGIRAAMDRLEAELGGGEYLVEGAFSVADLTAAALSTPPLAPPGRPWAPELVEPLRPFRDELEARPGGRWVARMYEQHRGVPVAA
ncbi:MAG: glutathione S-transferase family protein [Actinobacteria bacterium]|nr:glutathione S-transferase family protein [Actinomycetota bacterium]